MKKWKVGMMLSTIGILSFMNPVEAQEGNGNKIHIYKCISDKFR